mmetsp:Transcript_17288/g.51982  ORF Transcript_17288/g.51982 Transcript_17288/m.51982 type:complete len:258 (+) Transcript_17288:741-1514(+)
MHVAGISGSTQCWSSRPWWQCTTVQGAGNAGRLGRSNDRQPTVSSGAQVFALVHSAECWPCWQHTVQKIEHQIALTSAPCWQRLGHSSVNQNAPRVLNHLLDLLDKRHRLATVDEPVVIRQRQVHHRPRLDLAVGHHHGALRDVVHAQDGRLWRVDDRRRHHRAIHATIGDGKGAARHVVDRDGAVARLLAQRRKRLLDSGEAKAVGAAEHRHNESLGCGDGDGDVDVVPVHNLVALDDAVDCRHLGQRDCSRLDKC